MTGSIQIEYLSNDSVRVGGHMEDVTLYDKQHLVMLLAHALGLTASDMRLAYLAYSEFLAEMDLSNNRSTPDL